MHDVTVQAALEQFVGSVTSRVPERVLSISLYGSWARGKARRDSDIDVLVVVDRRDQALLDAIYDAALQVDLERLTLLSVKICPEQKLAQMRRIGDPFVTNVERDGRRLWTRTSKDASATG